MKATATTRARASRAAAAPPRAASTALAPASPSRRRRRRRGSGSGEPAEETVRLTSLPTGRRAYVDTREWLLARYGSVCAYCGGRVPADDITLDHVTPRRGQTAYDRRDNLVLSCRPCNAKKADQPILAYLLARRERAFTLLRYGMHLSPMLVDLAREIAGPEQAARAERLADPDYPYAD
ncbi:HNH endonuclease signature motif containing protein [Roseisolibacter sp. H3M3-2]|uniref:HNH endonuclease n=1 Tax=Roseisolibacter sp. H3M3-2 TaxID=3031323 RepID=UPI0023DA665A|nr:HNH endonuclease signature motif containing protein [Roseisolibacter sp. H3M3-2]MDF1504013.1 HNH endonuclease signature motif containing protein [Roseisolibacter sp. H3M3-2]